MDQNIAELKKDMADLIKCHLLFINYHQALSNKNKAVKDQNYESANIFRFQENEISKQLEEMAATLSNIYAKYMDQKNSGLPEPISFYEKNKNFVISLLQAQINEVAFHVHKVSLGKEIKLSDLDKWIRSTPTIEKWITWEKEKQD